MYKDNLQQFQELRNELKEKDNRIERLERVINNYREGGSSSICSVSKKNKKRLRIALRRKYSGFDSLSDFCRTAIEKYTGLNMGELYALGD